MSSLTTKPMILESTVERILAGVFGGIHHVPSWSRRKVGRFDVTVTLYLAELATYDFNQLTRLVVLCHDACVRCAVQPASPRHLRLVFSQRERDADTTYYRHPTMEQAIEAIRDS